MKKTLSNQEWVNIKALTISQDLIGHAPRVFIDCTHLLKMGKGLGVIDSGFLKVLLSDTKVTLSFGGDIFWDMI